MKLYFLGANRQVTGSRYVLDVAGKQIMIDCGLFQERLLRRRRSARRRARSDLEARITSGDWPRSESSRKRDCSVGRRSEVKVR